MKVINENYPDEVDEQQEGLSKADFYALLSGDSERIFYEEPDLTTLNENQLSTSPKEKIEKHNTELKNAEKLGKEIFKECKEIQNKEGIFKFRNRNWGWGSLRKNFKESFKELHLQKIVMKTLQNSNGLRNLVLNKHLYHFIFEGGQKKEIVPSPNNSNKIAVPSQKLNNSVKQAVPSPQNKNNAPTPEEERTAAIWDTTDTDDCQNDDSCCCRSSTKSMRRRMRLPLVKKSAFPGLRGEEPVNLR